MGTTTIASEATSPDALRSAPARIGMRELGIWCIAGLALAYWAEVLRDTDNADPLLPAAMAQSIMDAGAFGLAAWAMIFARIGRIAPPRPASAGIIGLAIGFTLLCAIPMRWPTTLAMAGLGSWLLRGDAARDARQVGQLLLALAVAWASTSIAALHIVVARLDCDVAAAALRFFGYAATAHGNTVVNGDFVLEVLTPCTSSVQLPQVVLGFVVVVLYLRGGLRWSYWPWLAGALVASLLLTWTRLSIMALNAWWWDFCHNGAGSTIYALAALASALLFPWLAVRRRSPGPAETPA